MTTRDRLVTLLALTVIVHVALAVGVGWHARRHGRDAGSWTAATLVGGLLGVVGYALSGARRAGDAAISVPT